MFLIDIPQVAYKTWGIEYVVRNADGTRDRFRELELERDMASKLGEYAYSADHEHVR